jgi:hypothetical protein
VDGATQLPFTHLSPEAHVVPQPPQLEVFDVVSMQVPLQSICPTVAQPQVPLLQVAPPGHTVQLVPQWAESVSELHAPSEHLLVPEGHMETQMPPLHAPPDWQVTHSVPQCIAFDATHEPEHRTKPDEHEQVPLVHVVPVPQALPHLPQFSLSVDSSTQVPLHAVLLPVHATDDPSGFDVGPSAETSDPPPSSPKTVASVDVPHAATATTREDAMAKKREIGERRDDMPGVLGEKCRLGKPQVGAERAGDDRDASLRAAGSNLVVGSGPPAWLHQRFVAHLSIVTRRGS